MEKLFFLLTIFTLIGYGQAASNHSFNVLDYGAVGDGHTSDSEVYILVIYRNVFLCV